MGHLLHCKATLPLDIVANRRRTTRYCGRNARSEPVEHPHLETHVSLRFSTLDVVPYRELARTRSLDEVEGWKGNETLVLRIGHGVRKSDGRPYDELSEEEQAELDNEPSLVDYVVKTKEYKPRHIIQG